MPTIETLKEKDVVQLFSRAAWNNALSLQAQVMQPKRDGNTLTAEVKGTTIYDVEVTVDDRGVSGDCTCPAFASYGLCKHIAAVLIRWLRAPHTFGNGARSSNLIVPPLATKPAPAPKVAYTPPAWLNATIAELEQEVAWAELVEALDTMTVTTLREIAASHLWTLSGTLKAGIVEQFAVYMSDPQEIAGSLDSLRERDRFALAFTAVAGGLKSYGNIDLLAEMMADHIGAPFKRTQTQTLVSHIAEAALAISSHLAKTPDGDQVYVPMALWPHLPPLLEALIPGEIQPLPATSETHVRYSQPRRIIEAAMQMMLSAEHMPVERAPRAPRPLIEDELRWLQGWEYDREELARLDATGKLRRDPQLLLTTPPPPPSLTDQHLQRFAPFLGSAWSADFLFALLEAAGIVHPGSSVQIDENAKRVFFQRPAAEQLAILFHAYTHLTSWQELWEVMRHAPQLKLVRSARASQYSMGASQAKVQETMTALRNLFLQTLAWFPEERWIAVESIMRLLSRVAPVLDNTWLQPRSYYGYGDGWHFTWNGKKLGSTPQDWSRLQGAMFGAMLVGPLTWFGLVDLRIRGGEVTHLRLHGLAHLWRRAVPMIDVDRPLPLEAAPTVRAGEAVEPPVVEDGTIRLKQLSGDGAMLLEKIGRPQSIALGNIVYQLDVARVHRAFEAGATVELLAAEWEKCFGGEMPLSLHTHLQTWWRGYGGLRIYEKLTLIEFSDDYALKEMRAVTNLDEVLLVELSSRAVLIPTTAVEGLMAALQRAGYTPKLTESAQ